MEKFIINGGKKLTGSMQVSGAKNVALKALVAACLTEDEIIIENVPFISDFFVMVDLIREMGGTVRIEDHTVFVRASNIQKTKISFEKSAEIRSSLMLLAPLLARFGKDEVPNPGGCRIGARPIDRIIEGLKKLGAEIKYKSTDGYFYAKTLTPQKHFLQGTEYSFEKNTHTGTETLIIAASLAKGKTVLKNAAQEPEVDELIDLLNTMGAKIKRIKEKIIEINGVDKLHGCRFRIKPDRNEVVTFAIAAVVTNGDIFVFDARKESIKEFLENFVKAGGGYEETDEGIRFYSKGNLVAVNITTGSYPGFMTDWQAPWAVLMTKAKGQAVIHETVYESRFGYAKELQKMGAKIDFFNPDVADPQSFYNFNISDDRKDLYHAIKIHGPARLHNAVTFISDLRAGATLVLAALAAKGESVIFGIEHLDRGYERFEKRLQDLGADIKRVKDENE